MPWMETNVQEERLRFIAAWKTGGWNMTELCRDLGISRKTGYKYLERYEAEGLDGLKDRSHAAHHQPNKTRSLITELIIEERQKHPSWGPVTLLARLAGRYPQVKDWPAVSTVGEILKREGLIQPRRKRRQVPLKLHPLSHAEKPNDLWCIDFKGHFTVANGRRCDPLTISDAVSRYLLACQSVQKTDSVNVQKAFERVFHEFGMPVAIRSDNGPPFASRGLAGLTPLAVWLLKLGIHLERIEPGKPYQNGRHERMHLTLKQHTALPPRSSLQAQQKAFDEFRKEYNEVRPHHALDLKTPAAVHEISNREFPKRIEPVEYWTNMETFTVSDEGNIRYGTHRVFLAPSLRGENIALEEISERHRRIRFAGAALGVLDVYTGKLLAYKNPIQIISEDQV